MFVRSPLALLVVAAATVGPAVVAGCNNTPQEPIRSESPSKASSAAVATSAAARIRPHADGDDSAGKRPTRTPPKRRVVARPVASVTPAEDDPLKGQWSLADATKDIKGPGSLLADIEVEIPAKGASKDAKGETAKLTCALFEDKAPLTVANFVGLARGTRPWKNPDNKWVKKPAYEGTIFHRIIKGFMIQGGDAKGTGTGEPGYVIPDEIWEDAFHDRAGLLCMANRGPNTNGAQFFITDASAPHLDNGYTIFGECAPADTVHKIAGVELKGERPVNPPKIKKVTIRRGTSPIPMTSASVASSASAPASASAAPSAAPAASKP